MAFNIQMSNTNINNVNMYDDWDPQGINPSVIFIQSSPATGVALYITTTNTNQLITDTFDVINPRAQWIIQNVSPDSVTIQDNVSNLYWTMDTSMDQANIILMPMMSSDRYLQQFTQTLIPVVTPNIFNYSNSDKTIYVGTDPSPPETANTPLISSKNTALKGIFAVVTN